MSGSVHVERGAAGVVTLRLDNPAHRNALNNEMIAAMTDAFRVLARDETCRVVVLRGTGGTFCAGREITDLHALQASGVEASRAAYGKLNELNEAVYYFPKPTVSVLERYALGFGILLAGWSDIAIAEEGCLIGYPEVKLGLVPTQTTVQLIRGVHRKAAMELLLTARMIRAAEAARLGLITRAVPADGLEAEAAAVIDALLAASPDAIAQTKQFVWKIEDTDYRTALTAGVEVVAVSVTSAAAREGVAAFVEKRKPQW